MHKLLFAFSIAMFLGALPPAFAAEAIVDGREIVYRANLGRADDVKLLITQGLSPNTVDEHGSPILALAATRKDGEAINVMKALLEAGADINAKDSKRQTALFYAARVGNQENVMFLLEQGIDYYALDNEGNVARTIAHNAGHNELVEQMDNFVKAQTEKRNQEYEAFNKAIEERYKSMNAYPMPTAPMPYPQSNNDEDGDGELTDEEREGEIAAPPPPPPVPVLTPEEIANAARLEAEMAKHRLYEEKRKQDSVRRLAYDISYASCVFQYWYYCNAVRQSTSMTPAQLRDRIELQKEKVESLIEQIITEQGQERSFALRISDSAKKRIYNELNYMPSNTVRREKGVGKEEDVVHRCEMIAMEWDAAPPSLVAPRVSTGTGGGIGGVDQLIKSPTNPNTGFKPVVPKQQKPRRDNQEGNKQPSNR